MVNKAGACLGIAGALALALFGLAFPVAPQACAGGFEFYFGCAVATECISIALPFVLRLGGSVVVRTAVAFGLAALGPGAWLAGMAAANVRFLCGLGYL